MMRTDILKIIGKDILKNGLSELISIAIGVVCFFCMFAIFGFTPIGLFSAIVFGVMSTIVCWLILLMIGMIVIEVGTWWIKYYSSVLNRANLNKENGDENGTT